MTASGSFPDVHDVDVLFKDIIEAITGQNVALDTALLRLVLAFVVGSSISYVLRRTYTGQKLDPSLGDTHVLLTVAGALVWVIIQNNLVRALGMASTMKVVRYRTVVRDPKDLTLLLANILLGTACGLGLYLVVFMGTMIVILGLLWLQFHDNQHRAAAAERREGLLELMSDGDSDRGDESAPASGREG